MGDLANMQAETRVNAEQASKKVTWEPTRRFPGWANYFCLGPVSKAYRNVDHHAAGRLRQWLRRKHKLKDRGFARYPDSYLYEKLGLVRLSERTRNLPWATA